MVDRRDSFHPHRVPTLIPDLGNRIGVDGGGHGCSHGYDLG